MRRPPPPQVAVALLMAAYVAVLGTLAVRRHQDLKTNALDLGYVDQAVWNTLHGRPFRFSTFLDAAFQLDIPIQDVAQPDMLLSYHVEPILALIAPLYLLHDGPETLLWLQTLVISLGAVPLYLLARHTFRRFDGHQEMGNAGGRDATWRAAEWLPVAFVGLYLLSPALQGANLSDFHAVALSPALLLAAFYLLETDHPWGYLACGLLAAMCKEEIGLLVAMTGLWAIVVRRRWRPGLAAFALGAGWFLLCVRFIMPHFSGLEGPAFLVRYGHLGNGLPDLARNLILHPDTFVEWLRRPDVLRYVRDLWLNSGGLAALYPATLVLALPAFAINALSSSAWMRSGGAHYSASIIPFLAISAVYGTSWLAGALARWRGLPAGTATTGGEEKVRRRYLTGCWVLAGIGLAIALVYHYQAGISPPAQRYQMEPVSEHARRAAPLIERVNHLAPDVPIAVGSNLYPHVAHRQRVYLFPTVSDAQYLFLDAVGPTGPASAGDEWKIVQELLEYGEFGVVAGDDGLLLLERGAGQASPPQAFYTAFHDEAPASARDIEADFAGRLRLEAIVRRVSPVVRPELVVEITTYWRAIDQIDEDYRLAFFFWDDAGRLIHVQPEERAVHWYPTWLWTPGETVRITLPPLPVGDLPVAGVAVLEPGAGPDDADGRLAPITAAGGKALPVRENGTILELWSPAWQMP